MCNFRVDIMVTVILFIALFELEHSIILIF